MKKNYPAIFIILVLMDTYFDAIYCINLQRCPDRKKHMEEQFAKMGCKNYQFVEAVDQDDIAVKRAYKNGLVLTQTPCFRCHQMGCAHKNKQLLPSQVANWLSYRKVWRLILQNNVKKALICEDDLVFMPYTDKVIENIFSPKGLKRRGISFDNATLVRLGWMKSKQHQWTGEIRVKKMVKMANPCHAISYKMAEKLDSGLSMIDTTSDGYIHEKIGKQYRHYTVLPPIAYELSFGNNPEFRSEIIPKERFIDNLNKKLVKETNEEKKKDLEKKIDEEKIHLKKNNRTMTTKNKLFGFSNYKHPRILSRKLKAKKNLSTRPVRNPNKIGSK